MTRFHWPRITFRLKRLFSCHQKASDSDVQRNRNVQSVMASTSSTDFSIYTTNDRDLSAQRKQKSTRSIASITVTPSALKERKQSPPESVPTGSVCKLSFLSVEDDWSVYPVSLILHDPEQDEPSAISMETSTKVQCKPTDSYRDYSAGPQWDESFIAIAEETKQQVLNEGLKEA